ncbi:glutamate-ammonia-ligase adenylyltransferase [Formosimonas limnophila]|uniref:Bifunctional glutamine synthetase adenylyltransferase/adenylyl-removing enzyme n=1 Tax=Formosimonas limnophila TaxID=1384487 RepID=A0A8J3CLX7_9BURK|nr:bifunctional [glutamate--ammonia ligase]-adenylyl-L-tyrosine phosphorylase/[glutamate--ammonia-ligase] adenylyltransferase [Formosimonas limnophila]GHA67447.1 glutamate-ammonia-ligase adenylyltransferase [Formosimonas limnophila]
MSSAQNYSNYAARQFASGRVHPDTIESLAVQLPLLKNDIEQLIAQHAPSHHDAEHIAGVALRIARSHLMMALIEYDLTHAPTSETLKVVTQTISRFADAAVMHAMAVARASLIENHGEPLREDGSPMPLWVMGMGKLAGSELNVSSDIDLIFVFEHEGETTGRRKLSHGEFFDKLGRKIIKLLDDVTEFGFVFRVDMRLRPHGSSGPLCVSLAMLEKYFLGQARTWERFAWLKSRLINPSQASDSLEQLITPFVFRRYLDYDAIDALRDVHQKIRTKADAKQGHDIKVGTGGIREIEFIVQLFQIIKGARQPSLQQKATLAVLPELGHLSLLTAEKVAELSTHYTFLRHLEHRIQYFEDAQTQTLPTQAEVQEKLAHAMQLPNFAALSEHLHQLKSSVAEQFNQLFEPVSDTALAHSSEPQNDDDAAVLAAFDTPNTLQEFLARLSTDSRITQLPERSQMRYRQLVMHTLQILSAQQPSPIPVEYAMRVFNFLDAIAKRSSYLALLVEYPKALEYLITLFIRSRWAGDYLTVHPILLDELLSPATLHTPPDWTQVSSQLHDLLLNATGDVERQMDILRETHHAQIFRLLAQELDDIWTVEQLADHLSDLTDLLLKQALHFCWQAFAKRHQDTPNFAIIAYGKLGGKEMGYASDLDLVFLYDDEAQDAADIYSRFAQRLNNWLTAPTAAGVLFETDYRLRPNGASGLLVTSLKMFKQYQAESAWFWEHLAITRARFCVGFEPIGDWFESERRAILTQPRERDTVISEILAMKQKIKDGHPNPTELFDVKYDIGGMVDIEFCVQALVLLNSQNHPELIENKGNIALLGRAAEAGLINTQTAEAAANAYRHYRAIQHASRLQNINATRVQPDQEKTHIDAVKQLMNEVLKQ